jgi:hypothetical protein
VLTAVAIGCLFGAGAFYAGPWLAAEISGLSSFAAMAALQEVIWVRRSFQEG